eukprot:TRINITY_DN12568_c0_g1_i2.p1 TRINITY_DN12568_c0_g1~~TRINITY_DN12568_c0_g1_i2.p1  ORF type:complete len:280 (+),score=101.97 TRINITY_DN12568_c0_g1_i2:242-1081(+)
MPALQRLCVRTWRRQNPGWDVRILCRRSVWQYLGEADLPNQWRAIGSHQLASDAVRLALLSRYGGAYLDAAIILREPLERLGWGEVEAGKRRAAGFYHPQFGTPSWGGRDFVESWLLMCRPHDPLFLRWRDLLREALHNRVSATGLLQHPLYQELPLDNFEHMNRTFVADFDFREYLVIHAMYRRILETEPALRAMWKDDWLLHDAAATAFRVQGRIEAAGGWTPQGLMSDDARWTEAAEGTPLIKLIGPQAEPLQALSEEQLLSPSTVIGRVFRAAGA